MVYLVCLANIQQLCKQMQMNQPQPKSNLKPQLNYDSFLELKSNDKLE